MACSSSAAFDPANMSSDRSDSEVNVNLVIESEVSNEVVSPFKVSDMHPSATEVDALGSIPCSKSCGNIRTKRGTTCNFARENDVAMK